MTHAALLSHGLGLVSRHIWLLSLCPRTASCMSAPPCHLPTGLLGLGLSPVSAFPRSVFVGCSAKYCTRLPSFLREQPQMLWRQQRGSWHTSPSTKLSHITSCLTPMSRNNTRAGCSPHPSREGPLPPSSRPAFSTELLAAPIPPLHPTHLSCCLHPTGVLRSHWYSLSHFTPHPALPQGFCL